MGSTVTVGAEGASGWGSVVDGNTSGATSGNTGVITTSDDDWPKVKSGLTEPEDIENDAAPAKSEEAEEEGEKRVVKGEGLAGKACDGEGMVDVWNSCGETSPGNMAGAGVEESGCGDTSIGVFVSGSPVGSGVNGAAVEGEA